MNIPEGQKCPMITFVNMVSGKWAIPVLYRLIVINVPVRFSDLKRAIPEITQKELTKQLRLFETRGIVRRQIYAEVPPKVEYQITELGLTLRTTLDSLAGWVKQNEAALTANTQAYAEQESKKA